ncbi:hypothetical protein EHW67_01730 [Arenibacter aquaticus]|uniref:C-type lysozyme inhibitor domain-containing protein n=1 Tax=Arenibacter aquaticus TaxID=2489054 RepID=A0A3S0AGK1_9FLAO|nr:MliC family protein [Arenibacter aquaticus]RTE55313.1 hypothetical protein EHW67_01730 [Arenibacter aquaticus]
MKKIVLSITWLAALGLISCKEAPSQENTGSQELEVNHKVNNDIVRTELKDKNGQTLDITFNNRVGIAKVYLNGGEQINSVAEKAASGIWYKNEQYELRGKGVQHELTKEGKTVFKN